MERVQLVLAEPAALLVAQRRGDAVLLEPGSDARQVVLVDEGQTVGLERATEIDGDDSVEIIFLDVVHQDSERTVVTVGGEVERHFSVSSANVQQALRSLFVSLMSATLKQLLSDAGLTPDMLRLTSFISF